MRRGLEAAAGSLPVGAAEGQLEGRALHLLGQDHQVVRVEPQALPRRAEQPLRVQGQELVHRLGARDHHRQAGPAAAPHPAGALPEGRLGARIADQQRHVEAADVDAQLQRVGGHDDLDRAAAQTVLDLAPQLGQVAAAVAADLVRLQAQGRCRLLEVARQHLDRHASVAEDDGLVRGTHQAVRQAPRLLQGVGAQARDRVEHRRVVHAEPALARGRAVLGDHLHLAPEQAPRVVRGLAQRGRAQEELRAAAVVGGDALEASQHVGHGAAEDAGQGVHLVDDDGLEPAEQLRPLGVVGQDPRVEHPRVGQHDVTVVAQGAAHRRRRVPVVGEAVPAPAEGLEQSVQVRRLVLAEGLGREQEHRPRAAVGLEQPLQDGQRVAQRLPRRGRRRDQHVATGERVLDRLRLVRVEPRASLRDEHARQVRVQRLRQGLAGLRARLDPVPVLEALAELRVLAQGGHQAVDAAAPAGTPLAAPTGGVLLRAHGRRSPQGAGRGDVGVGVGGHGSRGGVRVLLGPA